MRTKSAIAVSPGAAIAPEAMRGFEVYLKISAERRSLGNGGERSGNLLLLFLRRRTYVQHVHLHRRCLLRGGILPQRPHAT
jgi:hypothetical protein